MAEEQQISESEKKKEDWMNSKWRPMMGWSYMATCIFDFIVAPVLWSVLQAVSKGQVNVQWQPITLQGAGLYHIAMGAVLGIAAYGRTQEKLNGANNGGIASSTVVGTTYTAPAPVAQPAAVSDNTPVTNSWGSQPLGNGSTLAPAANSFGSSAGFGAPAPDVVTGFGGKPAPVIPPFPEK